MEGGFLPHDIRIAGNHEEKQSVPNISSKLHKCSHGNVGLRLLLGHYPYILWCLVKNQGRKNLIRLLFLVIKIKNASKLVDFIAFLNIFLCIFIFKKLKIIISSKNLLKISTIGRFVTVWWTEESVKRPYLPKSDFC